MFETSAALLSRDLLAENLWRLILKAPEIAACARPGQFVHALVPGGGHILRRPISLMAFDPAAGTLTLAVQPKGEGTRRLCGAQPGERIQLLGPLGNGFDAKGAKSVYFVGGGVGVAPLCAAMDAFAGDGSRAFFGFRSKTYAYGMTQAPCPVTAVTDDGSLGERALVVKPLERAIDEKKPELIMACGPAPMLRAVQKLALDRGIPCQLSLEQRMACGIGACLGCSVKCPEEGGFAYKRVCRDGPVFGAEEVSLDG